MHWSKITFKWVEACISYIYIYVSIHYLYIHINIGMYIKYILLCLWIPLGVQCKTHANCTAHEKLMPPKEVLMEALAINKGIPPQAAKGLAHMLKYFLAQPPVSPHCISWAASLALGLCQKLEHGKGAPPPQPLTTIHHHQQHQPHSPPPLLPNQNQPCYDPALTHAAKWQPGSTISWILQHHWRFHHKRWHTWAARICKVTDWHVNLAMLISIMHPNNPVMNGGQLEKCFCFAAAPYVWCTMINTMQHGSLPLCCPLVQPNCPGMLPSVDPAITITCLAPLYPKVHGQPGGPRARDLNWSLVFTTTSPLFLVQSLGMCHPKPHNCH